MSIHELAVRAQQVLDQNQEGSAQEAVVMFHDRVNTMQKQFAVIAEGSEAPEAAAIQSRIAHVAAGITELLTEFEALRHKKDDLIRFWTGR